MAMIGTDAIARVKSVSADHGRTAFATACRRVLFVALSLFVLSPMNAVMAAGAGDRSTPFVSIRLNEHGDALWRLVYETAAPVSELDLGHDLDGYRGQFWRVVSENVVLTTENGRDILVARDGGRFRTVELHLLAGPVAMQRTYEAFMPLGQAGVLLYTGHFQPWSATGARLSAEFTITPMARRGLSQRATAFGDIALRLENWRSRLEHPAFILVGPEPSLVEPGAPMLIDGAMRQVGAYVGAIDPAAPDWIKRESAAIAEQSLYALEAAFGWTIDVTPNFFIAYAAGDIEGRAAFTGDALPGQFRIALDGGAWRRRTPFTENVLRVGIAHEAAHLWQAAARPLSGGAPDWIHEGGANVIASDLLVRLGHWTEADAAHDLADARSSCADRLRGRALVRLSPLKDSDAAYYCGQTLNALAAAAHPGGVIGFWNLFIDRARAQGGYDAALFFDLAGEVGGPALRDEMTRFVRTNYARPERGFQRLDAALDAGGGMAGAYHGQSLVGEAAQPGRP
ncbi:MAG: hypothetical protein AAF224_12335 [Pseudomonadota bacterium]